MSQISCSLVDGTMWRDYNFHYQFNLNVLLNYFLFFVCYRDASFITCFVFISKSMARSAQIWWIFFVQFFYWLVDNFFSKSLISSKVPGNFTESPHFIAPSKSSNLEIHATFLGRSFPPTSPDNNRPFDRQLNLSEKSQSTEIERFSFKSFLNNFPPKSFPI